MVKNVVQFIKNVPDTLHNLPSAKTLLKRLTDIFALAYKSFDEDKCSLKASALTFFSLLSIVPVVAMMFGIAKGFGVEKILETQIKEKLAGQEEVAARILDFSNSLLQNTNSGLIVGVGIFTLFWTIIKLFSNIEHSFNDIWGIKTPRSFGRKISDYLSLFLICPIILVTSSSITVVLNTQLFALASKVHLSGTVSYIFLKLAPMATLWLLFTMLYMFLPNTKVKIFAGLLGGILGGTLFQLVQSTYMKFQIATSSYNAIYGSFAALPLFLVWLQISWLIFLFGAEISFAVQNFDTYKFESESLQINYSLKRLISVYIVKLCVDRFSKGDPALTADAISEITNIPIRLVRQTLFELVNGGVLSEIKTMDNGDPAYQPSRSIEALTVHYVISRIEDTGKDTIQIADSKELGKIKDILKSFHDLLAASNDNIPFHKI